LGTRGEGQIFQFCLVMSEIAKVGARRGVRMALCGSSMARMFVVSQTRPQLSTLRRSRERARVWWSELVLCCFCLHRRISFDIWAQDLLLPGLGALRVVAFLFKTCVEATGVFHAPFQAHQILNCCVRQKSGLVRNTIPQTLNVAIL